MEILINHVDDILAVIGGASVIARLTPTKADDKFFDWVLRAVNFVALNRRGRA